MKVIMINGSPKPNNSNSKYFLSELKKLIENNNEVQEIDLNNSRAFDQNSKEYFEDVYNSDVIVFGYPLYVDSIPSHLLNYMVLLEEYIKSQPNRNIRVYAIANCGFFEGIQNKISLEIMKNWCQKSNLIWGQGIGHGAGEMMGSIANVPMGHGPKKNLGKALNVLSENILKNQCDNNLYLSPNFPKIAFRFAGNMFWNSRAKSNNLKKRDLFRREK